MTRSYEPAVIIRMQSGRVQHVTSGLIALGCRNRNARPSLLVADSMVDRRNETVLCTLRTCAPPLHKSARAQEYVVVYVLGVLIKVHRAELSVQ